VQSRREAMPAGSGFYEWLMRAQLDLPDADRGTHEPVVDSDQQGAVSGENSSRHRVRNNLPGTPEFCPLVFKTRRLAELVAIDLAARAQQAIARIPRDLLSRTAAYLLLKDSRSSYAIEGERPPQDRIQRWGRAIGEAGTRPVDLDELLRLQAIVIGDARFVQLGLRREAGFVGEHDREASMPIPDHVSARSEDLRSLIDGMAAFDRGPAKRSRPRGRLSRLVGYPGTHRRVSRRAGELFSTPAARYRVATHP